MSSAIASLADTWPQWLSVMTRGVGVVGFWELVKGVAYGAHLGGVEVALRLGGNVAGGEQQLVSLAQWDVELLGEVHDHLRAGS